MKKKVLLMGKSGSGKTSMRSIIFSNTLAASTSRLGATIDVEMNHVRFLGSLVLNLWDCGGQDNFVESYLTNQSSTVFKDVGVLIYVFDVETRELEKDIVYYVRCLDACRLHSPEANVFVLIHKMDLSGKTKTARTRAFEAKKRVVERASGEKPLRLFPTSIWDESLYKAWSRIVHSLIPNAPDLAKHLTSFSHICSAAEVVLFERTTFLIIARSGSSGRYGELDDLLPEELDEGVDPDALGILHPERFEKISELIKAFKVACQSRIAESFHSMEIRFPKYTAILDLMTTNTYVLAIVADPTVQSATIKLNIRLAREKFDELQAGQI